MNKLENGMIFKSSIQVCKYLGFEECGHSNLNLQRLSHFCDYHRDENKKIYIDSVYEEPIPFISHDFKYKNGEVIKTNTGEIKILNSYRKYKDGKNLKFCICMCEKHDYEFELLESKISSMKIGCPLCGRRKVVPGIRSLYDCYPNLMKYVVDIDIAKKTTPKNGNKILCKCPTCGFLKEILVSNLVCCGFSCNICSDGISYPNKFITNMLSQLKIKFKTEKVFDWSERKKYDHFIEELKVVIENHGLQHYEETMFTKIGNQTLEDIQNNDIYKKQLAIKHNLNYFEIDCRKSNKSWIRNSVIKSGLLSFLNCKESDINWDLCDAFAKEYRDYEIWTDWNLTKNSDYLMEKYGLSESTIRVCVNNGYKKGYCNTSFCKKQLDGISDNARERVKIITSQVHSKPIHCITDDTYFYSKENCYEYYKDLFPSKSKANNLYNYINSNRLYKGKLFEYITKDEFNNQKRISEIKKHNNVFGNYYCEIYVEKEGINVSK